MTAASTLHPSPATDPSAGPTTDLTVDRPEHHPAVDTAAARPTPSWAGTPITAAAEAERAAGARCSVRSAPRREPPFDDEPAERHLHLVRTSTTPELPFPTAPRTADPNPRRLTLVPDPLPDTDAPTGPSGTPAPAMPARPAAHPDPTRFGRQFAQGAIEALSGRRPMVQLTRHVSPAVQRGLTRAGGTHPLASAVTPLLHSLHLSQPADGVCELSAIVVVGPRYRALAARLEWKIDHWRCTALQLG